MKAETDRSSSEPAPIQPAPGGDFEDMKRAIYRDIMNQIRTDFERGA